MHQRCVNTTAAACSYSLLDAKFNRQPVTTGPTGCRDPVKHCVRVSNYTQPAAQPVSSSMHTLLSLCHHCLQCLLDKLINIGGVNSETLPVVLGGVLQVSSQRATPAHQTQCGFPCYPLYHQHTTKALALAAPKSMPMQHCESQTTPRCNTSATLTLARLPASCSFLQSVSGPGEQISSGSGVSLLAASLPGVELMPFHVETPALPQLSAEQWSRLLTNVSHRRPRPRSPWSSTHIHVDSSSDDEDAGAPSSRLHNSTATLMLSAPHFTDVERLLQRFSNVLPGMPVLGGVTEPNAWGETEHSYGALFLGGRTFAQGAVGCVMHGPFAMQHLLVPGCRPVNSRVMTVTANGPADPSDILSLDGRPAQEPVSCCSRVPAHAPLILWAAFVGCCCHAGTTQRLWTTMSIGRALVVVVVCMRFTKQEQPTSLG